MESYPRRPGTSKNANHLQEAVTAGCHKLHRGCAIFFSCISSVRSNANTKRGKNERRAANAQDDTHPCILFFLAYERSDRCNDETFFAALHNQDVEPGINPIRVRKGTHSDMETAAHNNESIQEMVDISNTSCYRNAAGSSDSEDEEDEDFYPVHFPTANCCFVLVNHRGYVESMEKALRQLQSDGLVVHTQLLDQCNNISSAPPCNEVTATIRKIERVMQLCQHALYLGNIYAKPDEP